MFALYFVFFLFCFQTSIYCDEEVEDVENIDFDGFREPNEEAGKRLEEWLESSGMNAEEMGNYFEGDIMLPPRSSSRNGIRDERKRWKNATIPYVIDGKFDDKGMKLIKKAMETYHNNTCIRFVAKTSADRDFIRITSERSGCWSYVGRIGGRQGVNLQVPGCTTAIGTVLHELMHAAGFFHEHTRPDRDDYITVVLENVDPSQRHNFIKNAANTVNNFGQTYDYNSTMHYSKTAFSTNGNATMEPKFPKAAKYMGQRVRFSKKDLVKLNAMYKCPNKPSDPPSEPSPVTEPEAEKTTESSGGPLSDIVNSFFGIFNMKI